MFFCLGLESGQHVEILPMFSIALDSRVVNMLRFYEYLFFVSGFASGQHFEIQVSNMSLCIGFESGQQFEILPMCSIALDSRVVNMLKCY